MSTSPVVDTFRDAKYALLATPIIIGYGVTLLFFDQFLFFSPYFIFYLPSSEIGNLALDIVLTILTGLVLTVSIRQLVLQRGRRGTSKVGAVGIIAAILAGACPCYYLVPLLAVAGAVGAALGDVGILLNAFQVPIKVAAILLLLFSTYKLNKSGICKVSTPVRGVSQTLSL